VQFSVSYFEVIEIQLTRTCYIQIALETILYKNVLHCLVLNIMTVFDIGKRRKSIG
jgi:hypothetical protein